jgi:hypothetical protein
MEYNYLIIILIIFIVYMIFFNNQPRKKHENFTNKYIANDHIYLGHRRDPYDLLDDSLFTNVITFNNDDEPYECGSKTAIEKCLESCPKDKKCIEFGPGIAAHCI